MQMLNAKYYADTSSGSWKSHNYWDSFVLSYWSLDLDYCLMLEIISKPLHIVPANSQNFGAKSQKQPLSEPPIEQ